MKKNIDWSLLIKFLNVFGIILVVLGHSGNTESFVMSSYFGHIIRWIYSFHMPLFFFISGFLFYYTYDSFVKRKVIYSIKKKAIRLLFPYCIIGCIVWGIKFVMQNFVSSSLVKFNIKGVLGSFLSPQALSSPLGYLWFIFTLFIIFLIIFCLLWGRKNIGAKYSFCITLSCISLLASPFLKSIDFLNLKGVSYYIFFFSIGVLFCMIKELFPIVSYFLNNKLTLTLLFCLSVFSNTVDETFLGNLFSSIIGILFSLSLGIILIKISSIKKFVLFLSSYTYSIYLLHWFGQYLVKIPYVNLLHIKNLFLVPLMFLGGIIVPFIVCKFVDKRINKSFFKHISYIIGR